ncbi:MAG TPA: hypothetical protein VF170_07935 [Planctomycetaceae bacterium]
MSRYDYEGVPFRARDADGQEYVLTPLYRLKATAAGWEKDRAPEYCVGLRTEIWQWVTREGAGRYRITDTDPPTVLTSDDPEAV